MLLNLDADTSSSSWETYAPGLRFKIKPLDRDDYRRLRKKAREMVEREGPFNEECYKIALDRLIFEGIFEAWEGVVDLEKKPKPCTPENIDILCKKLPEIAGWALIRAGQRAQKAALIVEEKSKNSPSSRDGSATGPQ